MNNDLKDLHKLLEENGKWNVYPNVVHEDGSDGSHDFLPESFDTESEAKAYIAKWQKIFQAAADKGSRRF